MDNFPDRVRQSCTVQDGRLSLDEDTAPPGSTVCEELQQGRRSLSKQAAKGKPWPRKPEAAYTDGEVLRLAKRKSKMHLSKPSMKRTEKTKNRKKVVAARRKYHRRAPKQKWNTSSASDEDGEGMSFRHRRPNASKFSKIGPNSCVFLPVPEDIFIEDMLSDNPRYKSNSQLKSVEYWNSVAAELPSYQGPWRTRQHQ